jgi:hypothetical protein
MQVNSNTKLLLEDTYGMLARKGVHPIKNAGELYGDDANFNTFISSLAEGLDPRTEKLFRETATQMRKVVLESTTMQTINTPYNYLLLPLLRIYFPKLVSMQAVTVDTMDKPFVIKYFLQATAQAYNGQTYNIPDFSGNVSLGPQVPVNTSITIGASGGSINLVSAAGVQNTSTAGVEHDVKFISATGSAGTVTLNVVPDNTTGDASFTVAYSSGAADNFVARVNYVTGQVIVTFVSGVNASGTAVATPNTTSLAVSGTISMQNNENITQMNMSLQPFEFSAIERKLRTTWSIELEQDIQALMDLDLQTTMLELLGSQIAVDIDREIIGDLILTAQTLNSGNTQTFSKTPQGNFAFGPTKWYENLVVAINTASSQIYSDTAIDVANIVLCNNLDTVLLQSTGQYSKTGGMVGQSEYTGTTPFKVGELANSWTVLSTPLVPQGKMVVLLKSEDPAAAVYLYAMYRPLTIYPWPLGNVPSLTLMSRYAKRALRPKGIGIVNITT